jgi:hypothetical protein
VAFGGPGGSMLYVATENSVYARKTRAKGAAFPAKETKP